MNIIYIIIFFIMPFIAPMLLARFSHHLQKKWLKNKARQHINKIMHYHLGNTLFLKYICVEIYHSISQNPQLQKNLSSYDIKFEENYGKEDKHQVNIIYQYYKKLHFDIILKKTKVKSVEIIPLYLSFCKKYGMMGTLYQSLKNVSIMQLKGYNQDLPEFYQMHKKQKQISYYAAPLLAFLVIFFIQMMKQKSNLSLSLDDLINESGLKQLLRESQLQKKLNQKDFASSEQKSDKKYNNHRKDSAISAISNVTQHENQNNSILSQFNDQIDEEVEASGSDSGSDIDINSEYKHKFLNFNEFSMQPKSRKTSENFGMSLRQKEKKNYDPDGEENIDKKINF